MYFMISQHLSFGMAGDVFIASHEKVFAFLLNGIFKYANNSPLLNELYNKHLTQELFV